MDNIIRTIKYNFESQAAVENSIKTQEQMTKCIGK